MSAGSRRRRTPCPSHRRCALGRSTDCRFLRYAPTTATARCPPPGRRSPSSEPQATAERSPRNSTTRGTMAWVMSDYDGAERWREESRMTAEQEGAPAIVASVVHTLGVIAARRHDTATGRDLIARASSSCALPEQHEPLSLPVALGYGRLPRASDRPPRSVHGADVRDRPPCEAGWGHGLRTLRPCGRGARCGGLGLNATAAGREPVVVSPARRQPRHHASARAVRQTCSPPEQARAIRRSWWPLCRYRSDLKRHAQVAALGGREARRRLRRDVSRRLGDGLVLESPTGSA